MTGVMSLAGLGLIGAGAHAAFNTTTTSNQTVSAGTLGVVLSGPTGTTGHLAPERHERLFDVHEYA